VLGEDNTMQQPHQGGRVEKAVWEGRYGQDYYVFFYFLWFVVL
jgi:hypothetical protein